MKRSIGLIDTAVLADFKPYIEDLKAQGYEVYTLRVNDSDRTQFNKLADYCYKHGVSGVLASSMNEMDYQVALNEYLNELAPSSNSISLLKNKYCQRSIERNAQIWFEAIDIEEPDKQLLDRIVEYPFMLKATSAYLGRYIYRIFSKEQFLDIIHELRKDKAFQAYVKEVKKTKNELGQDLLFEHYPPLIAERCLDLTKVRQFSIDCYTTNSTCEIYSLREEIYLKDQSKIGYYYPPELTRRELKNVQHFIAELGKKFVKEGMQNHFFNIEIFLTENDKIILTEVNVLWNINYIHTMDILGQGNMLNIIFRHMLEGEESLTTTPFKQLLDGIRPEKVCLQSLIQITKSGVVGDLIDFSTIEKYQQSDTYRVTRFAEPSDYYAESQLPVSGLDCVNIWHRASSKEEALENDRHIRHQVIKHGIQHSREMYSALLV